MVVRTVPGREYVCTCFEFEIFVDARIKDFSPSREIVRCRDCRRSFEERGELWCRGIVGPPVEPGGFCAWGERSE